MDRFSQKGDQQTSFLLEKCFFEVKTNMKNIANELLHIAL